MPSSRLRATTVVSALLATVLLLSGCSGGGAHEPAAAKSAQLLPQAEGRTDYPLTLQTPYGDTTLEKRPERIAVVTASTLDTDALFALGGTPVFAPSTVERNAWLSAEQLGSVDTLWTSQAGAEASAEAVAAAKPDLIVALYAYDTFDQAQFDKMSAIAPVLYAEADALDWKELTRTLGDTLDLSDAAGEAVAKAEDAVAGLRSTHPEFAGRTATHVQVYPEEYGASYSTIPDSYAAGVFEGLGFALPAAAAQFATNDVISGELVALVDADFVLVSAGTADPAESAYFTESPLLTALPSYKDGRVIVDPADPETGANSLSWGINVPSALSVPWVSERIATLGAKALG